MGREEGWDKVGKGIAADSSEAAAAATPPSSLKSNLYKLIIKNL